MGFFSELKQDLSQAVNELMPDENGNKMTFKEAEEEGISLEEMISMIDNIVPEEEKAEPELTPVEDVPEMNVEDLLSEDPLDFKNLETELEAAVQTEAIADILPEDILVESVTGLEESSVEEVLAGEAQTEVTPVEETLTEEIEEIPVEDISVEDIPEIIPMDEVQAEEPVIESIQAEDIIVPALEEEPEMIEETITESVIEDKGEKTIMDAFAGKIVSDETSVITNGMTIKGDITSEGSLDVIGTVEGNIEVWGKLNVTGHVTGDSKAAEIYADGAQICGEVESEGAVKIGASTVIIGNIKATSAAIAGAVKGDIDVQGPVILDTTAIVMGNIKSKSVQINNGAVIEGMCSQCYADVSPTSFFDDYKMDTKKSK